MGDAVLVRSTIEYLHRLNPSLTVGVLAGDATQEVLTVGGTFRLHQYSQKSLTLRSALRTLREIKACRYDAILNFEQGSLAGSCFLQATGIRRRVGFIAAPDSAKLFFLTHGAGFQPRASMWQSFLGLARLVEPDLPETLMPLPLPLPDQQLRTARSWLRSTIADPDSRKIAFHLGCGSGQPFKRWPLRSFAALAQALSSYLPKLAIILTGQPHERGLHAQFEAAYQGRTVDATGLNSIGMTASILSDCDLLVSNDTGVMHLGAAMGTPTVGLFGATAPDQWAPSGPRVAHVYETKAPCSPCINSYLNQVPTRCANPDYSRCMTDVSVDSVLNAARSVIADRWLD
ncbi:MAG TPA: glycosyltransferase family 9 protein [Candidatus Binataceae bacterium]|nr:glycosyltransferase family 9 protein [Candidatus Binataceae bacterium]